MAYSCLAEGQGFEPWVPVREQRFSRPPRSTTPAPFLSGLYTQTSHLALFAVAKLRNFFGLSIKAT